MAISICNLLGFTVRHTEEAKYGHDVYAEAVNPSAVDTVCDSDRLIGHNCHEQIIRDLPVHSKLLETRLQKYQWLYGSLGQCKRY